MVHKLGSSCREHILPQRGLYLRHTCEVAFVRLYGATLEVRRPFLTATGAALLCISS
jgi:hypothetical protein